MKKLNNRVKENLKLGASTLINNSACVEMGRTRPWYSAVIAGIIAILISLVPIMVNQFSVKGSDFLSSPTYDIDNALVHFQEDLNKNNASLLIDESTNEMTASNWTAMVNNQANDSYALKDLSGEIYFEAFWTPTSGDSLTDYTSAHLKDADGNALTHSYIVFHPTGFVASKKGSASLYGQYDRLTQNFDIKDFARKDTYGNAYAFSLDNYTKDSYNEYFQASIDAWKVFFTDCYETYKITSAWSWIGIMGGVYTAFLFLMGLMLFLMTRGKRNPYRIYTFWETQKIAYWTAPASAVVGMVLGFILSSLSIMSFIFVCGIRVMWLSMKNLRPQA